jgi:MOSC domain-containing protein YiiM
VSGRVAQVSVSPGGVPKHPVPSARVSLDGLEGDGHRDREHHGGPERAVCVFSMELIEALRAEGHPVVPGALGENVTVEGVDWMALVPDACLLVGDVLLQVTRYTSPCVNITGAFAHGDFSRVSQKRHPGWSRVYTRVLRPGSIRAGDAVRLLSPEEAERVRREGEVRA